MDFKVYYDNQRKLIENFLETRMAKKGISKVDDAMAYSLLAGGKRIRPVLLMATAEALGKKGYNFLPVACGLEMIHTYSLIHDDLPCMDDDDYRRGRLTNHKVYGEAMAVLAGDGLLTLAFEVMLEQKNVDPAVLIEVVREMAMCAGNFGMVGGQGLDLDAEGKEIISVCNFTNVTRKAYRIGVPQAGTYRVVFSSALPEFGGRGESTVGSVKAKEIPMHGYNYSIELDIEGLSCMYIKNTSRKKESKK